MGGAFVQDLAVVAGVAGVTAALARWSGLPTLVGYLVAGLVVGPHVPIPLFADPERVRAMAEFGVILVMFGVGLEFRLARLLATLPRAGPVTLFEVGALAWLGWTAGRWLGFDGVGPVFLGAALAISSTMVVDRVTDGVPLEPRVREFVFGVLVVQDVVAIVLVAALSTLAGGESPTAGGVVVLLAKLWGALLAMWVTGWLAVPPVLRRVVALGSPEATLVTTAGVGFGFAAIAAALGYSAALGAFLGGVLVAESGVEERVAPMLRPLRDLFAAVFFVSIGMEVDPWVAARHVPTIAALSAVVIGGQLGAVTFAGVLSGNGLRTSVFAGLLLGQVGEFGFLLAALGVAAGVGPELTAVVVGVATVTTLTTPQLLARADRVVARLDRSLPGRLQRLLSTYEAWLDGLEPGVGWRWVGTIAVDAALVWAVVVGAALWGPAGRRALEAYGVPMAEAVIPVAATLVAAPLVVGGIRSTRGLARQVAADAVDEEGPARRLVEAAVQLLVLLGVAVPLAAAMRPFLGPGGGALGGVLVVGAWAASQVWRRAGEVDAESGAAAVVRRLTRPTLDGPGHPVDVDLRPDSAAVGRTLAELDLRARSGATVVAVTRAGRAPEVPRPDEPLQAGDVLALVGARASVEAARALLG